MLKFSGFLNCYRIFDIANEINLKRLHNVFAQVDAGDEFRLNRVSRSLVIDEPPMVISLGDDETEIDGIRIEYQLLGKLWGFGALSITIRVRIDQEMAFDDLKKLAWALENSDAVLPIARRAAEKIIQVFGAELKGQIIWDQYEDYLIFVQDAKKCSYQSIGELLKIDELYELISIEPRGKLSEQMKIPLRKHTFQYLENDVVILDWNSAYILGEDDYRDLIDVIEFGLCQLLELRYYDDLLDKKLLTLYRSINEKKDSVWKKNYEVIFTEASSLYLEISEVVEKIENSMKTIGDFYYAKIYRGCLERFRIKDWQASVDNKLKNLLEISTLFQNEIHSRRNHWLEIIVIILIAIEVIPFLISIVK